MKKKVLSLGILSLCVACCFAQARIAYCDVDKVLPLMPEMTKLPSIQQEYELYFIERLEEKEAIYQRAFKEYLDFAKSREVEENDEKKVVLENEVVALRNELKFQQEEMDYAMDKIKKDALRAANEHLKEILNLLALESNLNYVLSKPFVIYSEVQIDFTEKAIERAMEEGEGHNLMRGEKH